MGLTEIVVTIISSLIGGVVGGLFTFLGVKITLKHEDEIRKEIDEKKAKRNCPRLEIVKAMEKENNQSKKDFDILLLDFDVLNGEIKYSTHFTDFNDLTIYSLTFKNRGNTEIAQIDFSSNYCKSLSVLSQQDALVMICNDLNSLFCFSNISYIKPGETFVLKVALYKEDYYRYNLSGACLLTIWLHDINGDCWAQGFNPILANSDIGIPSEGKEYSSVFNLDSEKRAPFE